jgi:hypothetical protein
VGQAAPSPYHEYADPRIPRRQVAIGALASRLDERASYPLNPIDKSTNGEKIARSARRIKNCEVACVDFLALLVSSPIPVGSIL